jgi:hypothetical protein
MENPLHSKRNWQGAVETTAESTGAPEPDGHSVRIPNSVKVSRERNSPKQENT